MHVEGHNGAMGDAGTAPVNHRSDTGTGRCDGLRHRHRATQGDGREGAALTKMIRIVRSSARVHARRERNADNPVLQGPLQAAGELSGAAQLPGAEATHPRGAFHRAARPVPR